MPKVKVLQAKKFKDKVVITLPANGEPSLWESIKKD